MTATANIPNALRALADHLDQHPIVEVDQRLLHSISVQTYSEDFELHFYPQALDAASKFAATLTDLSVTAERKESDRRPDYWTVNITGSLNGLSVCVTVYPDAQPDETVDSVTAAVNRALQAHQ